jgi:hypothetical protein
VSSSPFPRVPFPRNGNAFHISVFMHFQKQQNIHTPYTVVSRKVAMGSGFSGTGNASGFRVLGNPERGTLCGFSVPENGERVRVPRSQEPGTRNHMRVPRSQEPGTRNHMRVPRSQEPGTRVGLPLL